MRRRTALTTLAAFPLAAHAQATPWERVLADARGRTVHFNAWAGSERVNAYLQWASAEVQAAFGIRMEHVKVSDTAEVVRRVRAEKAAGRGDGSAEPPAARRATSVRAPTAPAPAADCPRTGAAARLPRRSTPGSAPPPR